MNLLICSEMYYTINMYNFKHAMTYLRVQQNLFKKISCLINSLLPTFILGNALHVNYSG